MELQLDPLVEMASHTLCGMVTVGGDTLRRMAIRERGEVG
jgi:hypothetical protein